MMQNEISLAIECGEISEPVGSPIKMPVKCGENQRLCDDCQLGVPYLGEIAECPICGAAFSSIAIEHIFGVAGFVFPEFNCGTILNVCRRQPYCEAVVKYFVTSVSIGANCHGGVCGEDVI